MAKRHYIPVTAEVPGAASEANCALIRRTIRTALAALCEDTHKAEAQTDTLAAASYYQNTILKDMETLRKHVDQAEALIPDDYLNYPTYDKLLFSLR